MAAERHYVALNAAPGGAVNTLVLAGLDLTFPLEADLDSDPTNDDIVWLWSEDGLYDRKLTNGKDSEVQREGQTDVLAYTFPDVPPGIYTLSILVKDKQIDILRDIVVTRTDVLHDGKPLDGDDYDASHLGTPEVEEDEDPYDPDLDTEIDESFYGTKGD